MRLAVLEHEGAALAAVELADGSFTTIADREGRPIRDVAELLKQQDWPALAREAMKTGQRLPAGTALLAPLRAPESVICVGVNYRAHIAEMGDTVPLWPTLFSKLPRALTGPGAVVELPAAAPDNVDYEGELAIVIGTGGRDLEGQEAWDAIAGFTLANDVSVRDVQFRTGQWFAGKTWEAMTPIGPVIVTPDELPDLDSRELSVHVNGQARQLATIGDQVFTVTTLVSYISSIVSLRPGDLILTGTPGGVGVAMDPQKFLRDGDEVKVAMDGIGVLRNTFHTSGRPVELEDDRQTTVVAGVR